MRADTIDVASIEDYEEEGQFDLILLATELERLRPDSVQA